MTTETRQNITISVDGKWAGDGKLCPCSGQIEDCSAQFCEDNEKSLAVYDAIEEAIDGLTGSIKVDIDGETKLIEWAINHAVSEQECEQARTKAALYAEGTPLTADDLYDVWADACVNDDHSYSPQPIYEWVLRRHPQFEESWLGKSSNE